MKIYSFWSADTTYFTKFKSLKKAQAVGDLNMEVYIECCKELGDTPELNKNDFIITEVEQISKAWFKYLMETDKDTMILDYELEALLV